MKPEANSRNVLSTTRARAKMREFRVAEADFNQLPRDPAILFGLAIAILGDVAATIADKFEDDFEDAAHVSPMPIGWECDENEVQDSLRFASIFFDAYIAAELNQELTPELSLLCAATYYFAGNAGSAVVIVRHLEPPTAEIAGGLGLLLFAILQNDFGPVAV
jgi:helicase